MMEYSQRTIHTNTNIGEYLTEQSKEGWEVQHLQLREMHWHIVLVRDPRIGELLRAAKEDKD